jgi:hypothetical protein
VEALRTVALSFVFTTVFGGLIGTWLQRRTWKHQNDVRATEAALARADEVCRQLMQLLDRRLYRMLRLYVLCRDDHQAGYENQGLEERLAEYDAVLHEWNDQLNSGLAVIGTYFGRTARDWLEDEIYAGFQTVGGDLEALYRLARDEADRSDEQESVRQGLDDLNDRVYRMGVFLTAQILQGAVGSSASKPIDLVDSPAAVRARGTPLLPSPRT